MCASRNFQDMVGLWSSCILSKVKQITLPPPSHPKSKWKEKMQALFLDSLLDFIPYCNSPSCKELSTYTCFVTKLFLGRFNTQDFSPQIENLQQTKEQIKTKVQFSEPMSFIGVTFRNMGEVLLIETETTQRTTSCITKAHPAWELEHTAQPEDSSASWRVSFSGAQLV